jgi:SagB-type dehydrogenase family enzyme
MIDRLQRLPWLEAKEDINKAVVPTVHLTHLTGVDDLQTPDPTEDYHEASRMYPGMVDPLVRGGARLEHSAEMRVTASRSVKRHAHRPFLSLPSPSFGGATLEEALSRRRSRREYGGGALTLGELGSLLYAAYGVTGTLTGSQAVRTVPSGGALYPLELYVACARVAGAEEALYHYDPLRHGLELLRPSRVTDEVAELTPYVELLAPSAAVVVVTAIFWRSRFKYGARAYRFTLIEAGHAAQNLFLAAAALQLAAVPVGGFYDRRADEFVGADGIYEAALYLLPVGPEAT